ADNDGASRQARLCLYSTIDGRPGSPAPGKHAAAVSSCRPCYDAGLAARQSRGYRRRSREVWCFQRCAFLIAEIGLGKAGLVLSLDASRLARNNCDWHQLLELCSLFGVLIADGERLYDPRTYHDRLLLGLSGIMSEAELHQIKVRLHQGERQKAARGELRLPLPARLAHRPGGGIILNPDEEVQARLRLVFAKFRELRSAKAVMRALNRAGLPLPVRPLRGPAPHEVIWREASNSRVIQILKNRLTLAPMCTAGGGRILAAASPAPHTHPR